MHSVHSVRSIKRFLLTVTLILSLFVSLGRGSQAAGGRLKSFEMEKSTANWHVDHPKVVFAFGLLDEALTDRYSNFANDYFLKKLQAINPSITVEVIPHARGESVVRALKDPSTVGLIFISHTFQTQMSQSSVAVMADGFPLPMDILSAATPSLRFAGFFGCHGPGIPRQYEVEYEFSRTPGHHVFYYNEDKLLSANFLWIDDVKRLLKKTLKQLADFGTLGGSMGLVRGITSSGEQATLKIRVKDVVPRVEPRFVYVNDRVVGLLGSNLENSNQDLGYEEFTYTIPEIALQTRKSCMTVKILSSQLTAGAIVDDYLIESVSIESPDSPTRVKTYSPPLHLGESSTPLPPIGPQEPLHGWSSEKRAQQIKYLTDATRAFTWMDRTPEVWEASPLHGRFYIDCI